MNKSTISGAAFAIILILLAFAAPSPGPAAASSPVVVASPPEAHEGLLYGRVTTYDGAVYEGRLRWGSGEEALWSNYFNGFKDENPWVSYVPSERLPKERPSISFFGIEIAGWENKANLGRPFMARFGHIARIEPRGRDLSITLKSGTVVVLNRFGADDMNDGVRVWDKDRGVVDLGEWRIRTIDFVATPSRTAGPSPLHGTVRTRQGDFTGLVQWDRQECLGSDELTGHTPDGQLSVRFDTIRAIARRSRDSSLVTLGDGREILLSGTRKVGNGNRGIYVDDQRYGRVLISWDTFERVDFSAGGPGPAYGDFSAGRPLTGSVTTRSGRRLAGRLVYDLDEGETTETLDAPSQGIDYTILFGLVLSIRLPVLDARGTPRARVTLRSGEALQLELTGDLGESNGGMLVFDARQRAEYVPWSDVVQIDFDGPAETR